LYSRYINLEDESKRPQPLVIQETENLNVPFLEPENVWSDETLLKGLPKNKYKQGALLINHIKHNRYIKISKNGEISVDGRFIPNSHIVDLVHDFTRNRSKVELSTGSLQFATALKKQNIPKEYVGNSERWNLIFDSDSPYKTVEPNHTESFKGSDKVESSVDEQEASASSFDSAKYYTPKTRHKQKAKRKSNRFSSLY
jgi:hypothetical protein